MGYVDIVIKYFNMFVFFRDAKCYFFIYRLTGRIPVIPVFYRYLIPYSRGYSIHMFKHAQNPYSVCKK